MKVFYFVVLLVGIYALIKFIPFLFGSWRATLHNVITQYVACKQTYPNLNQKDLFFKVLDQRYPDSNGSFRHKLFLKKEETKIKTEKEIEYGMTVLNKYNLPALIYTCLVVEQDSILRYNNFSSINEFFNRIENEVTNRGFKEYI